MPDRIRKINQKISNFFKPKKTVFGFHKTILSKSDFDGIGKPNKEAGFLKPSFRKFGQAWSEWRLRRLRKKALEAEAENSRDGSLYKSLFENIRKGLKGKMGSKAGFPGAKLLRRKLAIGVITAMVMIAGVFVYFQTRVGATTYQWLQAAWTGGADTVNFPNHINNQSGWTKFFSKDTTQVKTDSGDIEINSTSSSYTETDNASGFSDALSAKSNTYTNGTGVLLKKNNGVSCTTAGTTNYECTSDNCDGDFSSGNYCHATATSCVYYALGTPWERATGYEQCSGDSYYKSCSNSVWGAQQNCDTNNAYCDAGGGATSGYDLAETCTSGATGGCNATSCTSCNGYLAASTSSCKTTCASASDCWSGYGCGGGSCLTACSASTACGTQCAYGGLVYNSVTANGRCWLDRNLGATQVAMAYNDANAYGWLYQWGRLTDGHQIRTSGTTDTCATGDVPGHNNFIKNFSGTPYDWRNPQNDSLSTIWGGVNGTSSPCPAGWRVPTQSEWSSVITALGLSGCSSNCLVNAANSALKLTAGGGRGHGDGLLTDVGSRGYYWSATIGGVAAYRLTFDSTGVYPAGIDLRAVGESVRCVKD